MRDQTYIYPTLTFSHSTSLPASHQKCGQKYAAFLDLFYNKENNTFTVRYLLSISLQIRKQKEEVNYLKWIDVRFQSSVANLSVLVQGRGVHRDEYGAGRVQGKVNTCSTHNLVYHWRQKWKVIIFRCHSRAFLILASIFKIIITDLRAQKYIILVYP